MGWRCGSGSQHLLSMFEAYGLIPSGPGGRERPDIYHMLTTYQAWPNTFNYLTPTTTYQTNTITVPILQVRK